MFFRVSGNVQQSRFLYIYASGLVDDVMCTRWNEILVPMGQKRIYYDTTISLTAFSFDAVSYGLRKQRYLYVMHSHKVVSKLVLAGMRSSVARISMLGASGDLTLKVYSGAHGTCESRIFAVAYALCTHDPFSSYLRQRESVPSTYSVIESFIRRIYCLAFTQRLYTMCVIAMCDKMRARGLASIKSRTKQLTVLRSVHIDKKSREQFKRSRFRKVKNLPRYLATFSHQLVALEASSGPMVCLKRRIARQIISQSDTSTYCGK